MFLMSSNMKGRCRIPQELNVLCPGSGANVWNREKNLYAPRKAVQGRQIEERGTCPNWS